MTNGFERRFARHRDELEWLFMERYDDRDALLRFEEMMQTAWKNREEPLRDLDRAREADPFWYRGAGMLGVTMYTDLFARSLRGGMEKLSYLRELGVTYLHLMPLLKMPHPQNDGGYAVEDFAMRNQKGTLPNDVWTGIEQLRKMRMHPCFAANAAVYTLDCGNHAILALSRERENERITAVFNFSDKKQCVHFSTQEAEVLEPYEMKLCTGYLRA